MIPGAPILLPDQFNAATYFIDRHIPEGRGEKIAIEAGEARVSYRQLWERVNRFGNSLRQLGVRIEERVFLLLLDTPEFAVSFFGAIKIGAVPVPVNTLLKTSNYHYILNNSRARVAVVSEALYPQLQGWKKLRYLQHVIVVGGAQPATTDKNTQSFAGLIEQNSPSLEAEPTSKDDAAFWLYSSGSTGFPKACVHLQHDMVVCAERYAMGILGMTESDRCFSVAKLFFAYGLGNAMYFPLAVGATSILWPGPPKPQHVFEIIERHRPSLFFSVPSNYAALLAHKRDHVGTAAPGCPGGPSAPDFDLSSVRYGISAGEALPAALFHRFKERFGVEILDAIGSTEVLHMFIANRPGAVRPGSSGLIIPGYEARVVDEDDEPAKPGEIGNLLIKSDSICSHYWNQHEKSKNTIEGHWIRTGDKYYQDADGYFWYAGRSDDMLKCSGVWVSPIEIEAVLIEHPAVQEAAVIGRKDEDELLKPAAYVLLKNGSTGTADLARELQEFVLSRLPVFKRPRWVEFVDELPKTATGKLQRYKLRELRG
ncbi:MAG TPA: benzoate-CoA ligase family protein [Terriglobales bacterium]|nr:benzoate-CoA ligase family protein [Terriglobales bacterium]